MEIDIFFVFRRFLIIAGTIYTAIRLYQSAQDFWRTISGREKHKQLMRRYLMLQMFRIRILKFWPQLLQIVALLIILSLLIFLHRVI